MIVLKHYHLKEEKGIESLKKWNTVQINFGTEKLISENLYQLFSYLKNVEDKGEKITKL